MKRTELKQMGLQADDVFRMVEMTIFLCILMPISVRWFASRWHAGIQLHRLINLVYFVDVSIFEIVWYVSTARLHSILARIIENLQIVRRHSHPHSWILNTPVFVMYIIDKYVFSYFFRRNKNPDVKRVRLGKDFMVLFWKSPFGFTETIGPDYSILMDNSSILEEKHIFTCFENRSGTSLSSDEEENEYEDFDWTVGVVVRVFRRPRTPRLGIRDAHSHTQRMYEEEPKMLITGPRQGEMSEMVRLALLSFNPAPLVSLFDFGRIQVLALPNSSLCADHTHTMIDVCRFFLGRDQPSTSSSTLYNGVAPTRSIGLGCP